MLAVVDLGVHNPVVSDLPVPPSEPVEPAPEVPVDPVPAPAELVPEPPADAPAEPDAPVEESRKLS